MRFLLPIALGCCVWALPGDAQVNIESAHISPTLYFSSAAEEASSRNVLHGRVSSFIQELRTGDQKSLPFNLDMADQLLVLLQRHLAYLRVQTLEDTQDRKAKAALNEVETDRSVLEAAVEMRLRQVPGSQVSELGRFAYLAQEARRDSSHSFSSDTERYRGSVVGGSEDDLADTYDNLINGVVRPQNLHSSDMASRRAAIAELNASYDRTAPVAATLLGEIVDLENRDAVAQGYTDASARKYDALDLSSQLVDQTVERMRALGPLQRRYEQLLAAHTKQRLQLSNITSADTVLVRAPPAPLTLQQARQLTLESLRPLGKDYTRRFAELLDPKNGRLDLTGGEHRAHTGTSISAYDAPVAFYYEGYDGSLNSIRVVAHEGGHAIHRELMNASGIPVYQREGPHYLFEGFAMFNELLLFDHAADVAKSSEERRYALERLLSNLSDDLFVTTEETSFERSLYTMASGHEILTRPQIDSAYLKAVAPFEYWEATDTGASYNWVRKALLFEDPLYEVNYLYAALVAVALYDHAHSDTRFAAKYGQLLRRGFYADPKVLLATMDIRLDDPALVESAAELFKAKTEELEDLYEPERFQGIDKSR